MSYIGQGLPADVFSGYVTDTFTGDGSATTFTLSKAPFSADSLIVVIDNVIQQPTTNFTVSGTTLTIVGTAILSGIKGYAIHTAGPLPIGGASELDLSGASDKLILDADADTTISADTDDQIDFKAGGVDEMTLSSTGLVINESSNDRDVRIESNGNENILFVDGGNDRVIIGGQLATFGILGLESASDATVDLFSNVGNGTRGKTEIFFSTDGSSDHHSCASIVMQQPSGDQASRKGEILLNVSDNGGPSTALTVANNGQVSGNLNNTSDENLKKNIEDLGASTDIIKALKPRKFDWKQTSAGSDIAGFVAQEVATVIPNAVVGNDYVATTFYEDGDALPDGYIVGDVKEAGDKGKALNTTAILAHAVKTIQELEARIKTLEDA